MGARNAEGLGIDDLAELHLGGVEVDGANIGAVKVEGLYLGAIWLLAVVTLPVERLGVRTAMGRASQLSRGNML